MIKSAKFILAKTAEDILLIILTSIIAFYFVETIYYQSFSDALTFIFSEETREVSFLNLCIILLFEFSLYPFTNSVRISFGITSVASCLLAVINELKMSARGEAFTFDDIAVAREALLVAGNYGLKINGIDIWVFILIGVLIVILILFRPSEAKTSKSKYMIIIRIVSGLICIGIYAAIWMNIKTIMEQKGKGYIYVASDYYDQNGFLVGLARTTPHKLQAPKDYSKETLMSLRDTINYETKNNTPNIIFIMNESLYDIGLLEGVVLSEDPLNKLKELQTKYTYGSFISPAYGGGTCNVEFEVLTGCPMEELGATALPYSDMIHGKINSLVSLMNRNGYYTAVVHPNTGKYFNRRNVYGYMGFDSLLFSEEMGDLPLEGLYPSDYELYKRIIEEYENNSKDSSPFFSYVITMQNHGGYAYEYYNKNNSIKILDEGKFEDKQMLQTYINLEYSSIEAFEYLVDYFDGIDEPTVIIMFGDHSPGLRGFGYEFASDENSGDLIYRTTPLIVYNNYGLPCENWEYVNGYNLASKVLNYCGINMDDFWAYGLEEANVPILGGNYYINGEWIARETVPSLYSEHREKLWTMAYDRLFGKNYGDWEND